MKNEWFVGAFNWGKKIKINKSINRKEALRKERKFTIYFCGEKTCFQVPDATFLSIASRWSYITYYFCYMAF